MLLKIVFSEMVGSIGANGTVYEVKLWNDGDTISEEDGDAQMFNPFALVALLTQLGYAPQP